MKEARAYIFCTVLVTRCNERSRYEVTHQTMSLVIVLLRVGCQRRHVRTHRKVQPTIIPTDCSELESREDSNLNSSHVAFRGTDQEVSKL